MKNLSPPPSFFYLFKSRDDTLMARKSWPFLKGASRQKIKLASEANCSIPFARNVWNKNSRLGWVISEQLSKL
jgi:hypothetical protein